MPIIQHFIVEGRVLGCAERQALFVHAQLQLPTSYAFFCPVCSEVWARCPVVVEGKGDPEPFMVWTLPCRKHPTHQLAVPGSLMLSWEPGFVGVFPDEVVKWEFDRHLEFYEREGELNAREIRGDGEGIG